MKLDVTRPKVFGTLSLLCALGCTTPRATAPDDAKKDDVMKASGFTVPAFGPNVFVFDPSMPASAVQAQLDTLYRQQERDEFGEGRYALLFKPGAYENVVNLGYYMTAHGLGQSPDDTTITGNVRVDADWNKGMALINFWRGAENLAVVPTTDEHTTVWAVSQATSFRRMHVKGNLNLSDNGWSSGGFIADSKIDGLVDSGTQQQFLTRNGALSGWKGANFNMVYVGTAGAPANAWPEGATTELSTTQAMREKPFLTVDAEGRFAVQVPALRAHSQGPSWTATDTASHTVGIDAFHIARADVDTEASIHAALESGKHLLLTPGIYKLSKPLRVQRADTIVLGMGLATLRAMEGNRLLEVDDVDGVTIAGVLLDAGLKNSDTLLRVGAAPGASHARNPILIADLICRVGGGAPGRTDSCVVVNAHDTIIDHTWLWRADHGPAAAWDVNPSKNGIIVNGDRVSAYGLFVEHFTEYQTLWKGEDGRVVFYQSEMPYDVPSQEAWTHDGEAGYASMKIDDHVERFEAKGLGAYCVFHNQIRMKNAFEAPAKPGVKFNHVVTAWFGKHESSAITSILNTDGLKVDPTSRVARTRF
jgi:hypothetical protein